MDQFELNKLKNAFSSLIEGTKTGEEEYDNLNTLLQNYPYCQPLHLIKAAAERNNPDKFREQLSKTALYTPNREVLYKYIYERDKFYETIGESTDGSPADESLETISIANTDSGTTEDAKSATFVKDIPVVTEPVHAESQPDESHGDVAEEQDALAAEETQSEIPEETKTLPPEPPIFDNIASSDYFTFNKSTVDPLSKNQQEEKESLDLPLETAIDGAHIPSAEGPEKDTVENLSKYHDEELPYTFLWWLQKTRKEHAHTYQPYATLRTQASEALRKTSADELNHQIIENIFHLQVPITDEKTIPASANTVEFELRRQGKKEYLIEKFIKEEPQIRPPKAEKIDTENKARKSSEDNLDLVSETLAHIYIEQMLYHKAIDTYKKLSLKFPEKSAYFADQINEIQKKIS